jgi:hypothetical protein
VTQVFLRRLEQEREEIKQQWADGAFVSNDAHTDARLNTAAIASVKALEKVEEWIRDKEETV